MNSKDYKGFDIYADTIKTAVSECHHLINHQTDDLF